MYVDKFEDKKEINKHKSKFPPILKKIINFNSKKRK